MNQVRTHIFLTALVMTVTMTTHGSGAPTLVSSQGYLTDASDNAPNGLYNFNFRIYNAKTGGSILRNETHNGVQVTDGQFQVLLGSIHSPSTELDQIIFVDSIRWLGVAVNFDPEIPQRTQLVTVPWAFRVGTAESAQGGAINGNLEVVPGNLWLASSTLTNGNILKGSAAFIHDYGRADTLVGGDAGIFSMSGITNSGLGRFELAAITTGSNNSAGGADALHSKTSGFGCL